MTRNNNRWAVYGHSDCGLENVSGTVVLTVLLSTIQGARGALGCIKTRVTWVAVFALRQHSAIIAHGMSRLAVELFGRRLILAGGYPVY